MIIKMNFCKIFLLWMIILTIMKVDFQFEKYLIIFPHLFVIMSNIVNIVLIEKI